MSSIDYQKPLFLVGLGNPGYEYSKTRHNVGWIVLDRIIEQLRDEGESLKSISKSSFHAEILFCKEREIYIIKPQTFMNDSGKAVAAVLNFYAKQKIEGLQKDSEEKTLANLMVVHDDLDLELGEYKLQMGRGPKVHNGLLSLYQHLGTKKFWHFRVGIDARNGERTMPGSSYVLQRFTEEELSVINSTTAEAIAEVGLLQASK